ncbi:MAG TPA: WG repeat-containing protein [Polyangiaceae bacterium]|jgi:hypothetical protein|nr:WG repeat-containing protein [Polyangiaceae bacterium]
MQRFWLLVWMASCAQPQTPVADVESGGPEIVDRGSRTAASSPADEFDQGCEPEMFMDRPAGAHGLHAFEDASGQYGFRDGTGKVLIAPRFRFAYQFGAEGVAAVIDDGGPAFIDTTGRMLARAYIFDNGPDYFVAGRARIVKDGKVGFIDRRGRIVVEPRYDYATSFCEARAAVCIGCRSQPNVDHTDFVGGRWGYIDPDGRTVVALDLEAASEFSDGEAHIVKRGKGMRIDRDGHVLR